jgi:phosphotransferase system  glucose/maltose/N-acetylglucosamine-specific IIC component
VIDLFNNLIAEAQDLVTAAVVLIAIAIIVSTWAKTRAFVPTLGAIIFGALVVWAVRNVDFLQDQIGEDIVEESGLPAAAAPGGLDA